jgi:hypothetical protein
MGAASNAQSFAQIERGTPDATMAHYRELAGAGSIECLIRICTSTKRAPVYSDLRNHRLANAQTGNRAPGVTRPETATIAARQSS